MAEHPERVELVFDDNFVAETRKNLGNVRRAVREFDSRMNAGLVAKIDDIPDGDPEIAHSMLDDLLEAQFPDEVRAAIQRLKDRCSWWGS